MSISSSVHRWSLAPGVPSHATAVIAAEREGLSVEIGRHGRMSLRAAIAAGYVVLTDSGRVMPTIAGTALGAHVTGGSRVITHTRRGSRGFSDTTSGTGDGPAEADASARTLAKDTGPAAPQPASQQLGNVASAALLARGLLRIAQGPGLPAWQTVYFAANGINRYTGHKFLPAWMGQGPAKIAFDAAILGPMLRDSWKALPGATALWKSTGSLLSHMPADAAAAVKALPAAKANVPAIAKLFPLIKPLYMVGMGASSLAGVVALPEYLRQNGVHGLLTTTSGRDAWIGALSGVATLGSMFLPASPLQLYVDFASNVLWLAQTVNGYGWLDSILGGDSDARESRSARTVLTGATAAGTAAATSPAAAAIDARKAAAARSLTAITLASGTVAPVDVPNLLPAARRRRHPPA